MCNAWNHNVGCRCGFGGEDHSYAGAACGKAGPTSYERYVNPFARCPVCGCPVFFFQDDNGGRVFFDELGPPWPKHPCTDRRLDHDFITVYPTEPVPAGSGTAAWERDGWSPFLLMDASLSRGQRRYRIYGRLLDKAFGSHTAILMNQNLVARVSDWVNRWGPTAPTFYRRTGSKCELSSITLRGGQITEHFLEGEAWC